MIKQIKNLQEIENKNKREYLIDLLQHNEVTVTFTKADGSVREMRCTLESDKLPKREITEDKRTKKEPNLDIIPVFDLEKKAWRSFRVDSVKSFTFSL